MQAQAKLEALKIMTAKRELSAFLEGMIRTHQLTDLQVIQLLAQEIREISFQLE
jgi:hypothetical protein